jgi:hypothetical protein
MIDFVNILQFAGKNISYLGVIDNAKSIIWKTSYYGVGDFELYVPINHNSISLLIPGFYVSRNNKDEVGLINRIEIINSEQDGRMIVATGKLAKNILSYRHIYNLSGTSNKATVLRGKIEEAVREVVNDNAINCSFDSRRNFPMLRLGPITGIEQRIIDEEGNAAAKQVSYDNLLTYTDGLLREYGLASKVILNEEAGSLDYVVYSGKDRTMGNTAGNISVIFSEEFDNLVSSNYVLDDSAEKNAILIGGEGEGTARFYTMLDDNKSGIERKETWLDAGSISKTYKDESDTEQTYSDDEYSSMLKAQAHQTKSSMVVLESMDGVLDISNGTFRYGEDFTIGDIVTVQDININVYINVRIVEVIEVQDDGGYSIAIKYQS